MPDWIEKPEEYDDSKSLRENKQRGRGVLRCHCGNGVDLFAAQYGPDYAAECGKCGQLYNLTGQQLVPRDQWEEDR